MFAAAQHSRQTHTREKFARISNRLSWMLRYGAGTHHAPRRFKRQIEHGREIYVKTQGAAVLADDPSMLSKKLAISSGEHFCRRRCGGKHFTKAVNASTFEINASE